MPAAVAKDYRHVAKSATPRGVLDLPGVCLKFYEIAAPQMPVPAAIAQAAHVFVKGEIASAAANLADDAGFVILHRCGSDFYFLLVQVWRGNNELWEAVFARSGDAPFAAFGPAYPQPGLIRPTFCVWELGVIAHEARAWAAYIGSPRDDAAFGRWASDSFEGSV